MNKKISENQMQTKESFGYKWKKTNTYESEAFVKSVLDWLVERYCAGDSKYISEILPATGTTKKILDAGCGAGFTASLLFGSHLNQHDYYGVDISDAVKVAETRFKKMGLKGKFFQQDIQALNFENNYFDIIYSEGVLHHTDSTEKTLISLSQHLKPGGLFLFYVYKKKSAIREFTDDYIRQKIAHLSNEEAWEQLYPLSKLGVALGQFENIEIEIPEDVPLLEIKKGKMSLQRFFYWHVCKMYFRHDFSLDELNHVNFDWFRPLNCQRHTLEQINEYTRNAGLKINYINDQDAGFTVRATKET